MVLHCCVPGCTKKGYRDENGDKVSYFGFPSKDKPRLRKAWIHAVRRDEGKFFTITESTKVCSRHFRDNVTKKTLAGRTVLRYGAVPSLFEWNRTSPRKRNPPTKRLIFEQCPKTPLTPDLADAFASQEQTAGLEISLLEDVDIVTHSDCSTQTDFIADLVLRHAATQTEPYADSHTIENLERDILALKTEICKLQQRNQEIRKRLFSLETIQSTNSAPFYTGFQNWEAFMAVYDFLDPGESGQNINYWRNSSTNISNNYEDNDDQNYEDLSASINKKGRSRSLKPSEEFFLTMCRLRQGFHEDHLAHLFNISPSTVSRIFITWINFMFFKFGQINIWPSRQLIDSTMPECFKAKYASTRVIIDCTEVRCQMPSSLQLNGELFSSYKNHTTLKGLVGISPGGALTFISQLYTGGISDREIVRRSGFLDLPFEETDSIMADKGFTISDLLPLGVGLNLPPFLGGSSQMPSQDVVATQEIASVRIHVERAINKIKKFHVWDRVIPLHQFGVINQMWAVAAFLCNAHPNIISI